MKSTTTTARAGRIRVAHLINHLGYGGSERQLFLLLSHFDRSEFEHRVVVFNPSPEQVYDHQLEALGIRVAHLPASCRGVLGRLRHFGSRLRRWRPHVVHSWTVHDNPYAGLAGLWAGAPVRWGSLRGTWHTEGLQSQSKAARWLMLRGVQRVVVNSRALVAELVGAGLARGRIVLLPNCVPEHPKGKAADLRDLGIGSDDEVVGMVGNLRRVKNHSLFLRAMAKVVEGRPEVRALIVGQALASEPEYRSELESEIDTHGLSGKAVLAGFRHDVPRILQRLKVLCLTSHSEGLPNAILEAMAAGRPVVACRVGGVADLVDDGVEGFLLEPGDGEGLADAICRLLDDPQLADKMGAAGRERVRREFGCDVAASRLALAYRQALEGIEHD